MFKDSMDQIKDAEYIDQLARINRISKEFGERMTEFCSELYKRDYISAEVADELIDVMAEYERKGLCFSGGEGEWVGAESIDRN